MDAMINDVDAQSQFEANILDRLTLNQALRLAEKKDKQRDSEQAKRIFRDILVKFPKNKKAQQGLTALNKPKQSTSSQSPPHDTVSKLFKLYNQGELSAVVEIAQALVQQYPGNLNIWSVLGAAQNDLGRVYEASVAFKNVTVINPNYAAGFSNLGTTLQAQGKLEEAIAAYNQALSLKPDFVEAYSNMGNALKEQGKLEEAIVAYNQALSLKPDIAEAYSNMGNVLEAQGKLDEAIQAYSKAIALKPAFVEAYNNLGNALKEQCKLEEAIVAYNQALSLKPDIAEAYHNLGNAFQIQGKLNEAILAYNQALSLKPDYAKAYNNMGNTLLAQGKLDEAIEAYNEALSLKPDYAAARAQKLHQQAHICDWDKVKDDLQFIADLGTYGEVVPPFSLLAIEDAPDRHRLRSENYSSKKFLQKPLTGFVRPKQKPERLRIGYFSADFKEHAVAHLIAKVIETHDRDCFEVYGYSIGSASNDKMRHRLVNGFDVFHDLNGMSDKDAALLARHDKIDIAVDLTGYTMNSRPGIFAYRAAPIQINYLGFAGTLGADFMDYIVADKHLIPPENHKYFNEKTLYLPNTYMPTDDGRELSEKQMTRSDMGLPDDAFVFCCFNNNYKISSSEFDIWMRLLNKVEGSVLWLRRSNEISHLNIKNEAQKRDVNPSRIVFADRVPMDEHLARQKLADLFVDTFIYNAHTTATEALWAGLPVITKMGEGFASRVGGSLLNAVGLPELVTETEDAYEALAFELATNSRILGRIRAKLAKNRLTQPLFDTKQYTKHLENGYQQVYQHYFDGKPPQVTTVPK